MPNPGEKSTILLVTAAVVGGAGWLAWSELRARGRKLPAGTPAGTVVTAAPSVQVAGSAAAPALPATLTAARVNWVPVGSTDPVTQGQTFAFYDAVPARITMRDALTAALSAYGWSNVRVDAMPGEILPAWLPVKQGLDVSHMFAARGTWSLMTGLANRPAMLVAYRPQTPVRIKQSQTATSLVHGSSTPVVIYTVTDGTWWWGSFVCSGAGGRPIHPQAVGYTSAECMMKLQPLLAHCAAPAASPLPPLVAG